MWLASSVIVVVEWLWRQHKACIETVFIVYSNLLSGTHQEEYKRKNKTISEGETRMNSLSSLNLSLQSEKESSGKRKYDKRRSILGNGRLC